MSLEEYIERLGEFRRLIIQRLPEFTAGKAMDVFAMIRLRIIERGLIGEDEIKNIYTSEPYKKKRRDQGRQTEYVDLTFTRGGAGMLGSTGLVLQEMNDGIAKASVAGRDEFTQDKLDWNSDRYGDVLGINEKENEYVIEQFDKWVLELATEAGIV